MLSGCSTDKFSVSDNMTDDVERQPLLASKGDTVEQNGGGSVTSGTTTTVSPIGPDELPPPYSTVAGGVPMVSCRVCSHMIDISGKKDQVNSKQNNTFTPAVIEQDKYLSDRNG